MTLTLTLTVALAVVAGHGLGVVVGWYLRKKERWCGSCSGRLTCALCQPAAHVVAATGRVPGAGRGSRRW